MFNIDDFSECVKTLDIAINVYLHLKILVATMVKMTKKKIELHKVLVEHCSGFRTETHVAQFHIFMLHYYI